MDEATLYNRDPAAQAQAFEAAGSRWLHIVDLNGAFAGRPVNGAAVRAILAAVTIPVQLGGGIRDLTGIDARGGKVAVEGWAETSSVEARDLALAFEDAGVAAIVYTDIERDGALEGPNVTATAALARAVTTPVIASGGISSLEDLRALKAHERDGVAGIIMGRALYDGRLDLAEALQLMAE